LAKKWRTFGKKAIEIYVRDAVEENREREHQKPQLSRGF